MYRWYNTSAAAVFGWIKHERQDTVSFLSPSSHLQIIIWLLKKGRRRKKQKNTNSIVSTFEGGEEKNNSLWNATNSNSPKTFVSSLILNKKKKYSELRKRFLKKMIDSIKSEKNRKKKKRKKKSKPQKKRWDFLSISLFSYINPFIKLCYKIQLPSLTKATPDPLQTLVIEEKLIKICVSHIDKTCRIYTRFASFLNSKIVYCWNISANSKFVCFVFFF